MKTKDNFIERYISDLAEKGYFEAIGDGISIQDTNFKILYQNSIHKSFIGDYIGQYCYKAYQKRESKCKGCPLEMTFQDGLSHTSERSAPTHEGESYFEITSSPLKDTTGKIVAGIEVVRNIDERKRIEEKIHHRTEELAALLKISQGLATTLSLEKVLQLTVNEAVKLMGLGSGAIYLLEGDLLHLLATMPPLPPEFPEKFCTAQIGNHPHIRKAITTRRTVIINDAATAPLTQEEQTIINIRGLRSLLYIPLKVEDTVLGVLILGSVGKTFVISEAMINLGLTMSNQAALAIHNAQLYEGRKKAYKKLKESEIKFKNLTKELIVKNKEFEQVLFVTSHDLRSPLVNIEGYSKELDLSIKELMSSMEGAHDLSPVKENISQILKEDIPEQLHYIQTSASKMDVLLKGILTLSRLGKYELRIEEIDMNKMITDIIDNHKFKLNESGIKTEVSKLPHCSGDRSQMNQLFSNLLDNAIKYSDPVRRGVIKVFGYRNSDKLVYCIEDNGIGIAPEHQEKIFEIFHQLEPDRVKGEGMGLAIANRIIDKHNGKIWLESELGKGSKFFVSVPLKY